MTENRQKIAISGSHGVIGEKLMERLKYENVYRLGRDGVIPNKTDVVFDLASYGNLYSQYYIPPTEMAVRSYTANLMRLIKSIDEWDKQGKFIYISTSAVILTNKTFYSLSKEAAEKYIQHIQPKLNLKIAIVRPYTVIGVGEHSEHLIPTLIDSCLSGTKIPFVSWPKHDFISYDDFIDALLLIKDKGELKSEIYEIGSGKEYTNEEVKNLVEKTTGKKANIEIVDNLRQYDSERWRAPHSAIYRLGWKPKQSLEQIIEQMVYAKKNS